MTWALLLLTLLDLDNNRESLTVFRMDSETLCRDALERIERTRPHVPPVRAACIPEAQLLERVRDRR